MSIPVALSDHCRLILKGKWDGKVETNNVFYFKVTEVADVTSPPATLADMADGFWQMTKAALLNLTSSVMVYNEIVAELLDADANLVNGESWFIPDGDGAGAGTAESLPPADAWTFKIVRPNSAKRHGFKRFAGIPEEDNVKGFPSSGAVTSVNALAAILAGDYHFYRKISGVETNINGTFNIELVQKMLNGDVVSPAVFYFPATVVFDKIGHQDTRDIGRGV